MCAKKNVWHDLPMLSDQFRRFISTLREQELAFPCTKNHKHVIVVVNAYDVDLYQSWTIEMQEYFQNRKDVEVRTIDLGITFFHKQRTFFRQCLTLISRRVLRIFSKNKFRYLIDYDYKPRADGRFFIVIEAFISTCKILKENGFKSPKDSDMVKYRAIFSTLATTFNTVEFNIRRHPLRLFVLNLAYEMSYAKTSRIEKEAKPCLLVVGNGRMVKAAAVVASSRDKGTPVIIIERGSFPGTFDLYRISPHSILERRMQAQNLALRLEATNASRISSQYIELRKEYDPISGLKWHRNFKIGCLPDLDYRKLCVCFTSTETEFAVFGDVIHKPEFQNQAEAFYALAATLNPNEWQVVIRRHPYGSKFLKKDPESKLWEKLKIFQHVSFVGPSDPIDSYELCRKADLVAHFNSSMGPEAIAMQCCPVITMGPTLWEKDDSKYFINTKDKLIKFFGSDFGIRPVADIELWGIYWATFGYKFEIVSWNKSKGFVHGKRIL